MNTLYFNLWENQEQESINLKCFFELVNTQEQEQEQNTTDFNEFFIYSDGVMQNRNIIIVDRLRDENQNKKPFKAVGYLSKAEKSLLKAIKKR